MPFISEQVRGGSWCRENPLQCLHSRSKDALGFEGLLVCDRQKEGRRLYFQEMGKTRQKLVSVERYV